jgi:hypothetical protein
MLSNETRKEISPRVYPETVEGMELYRHFEEAKRREILTRMWQSYYLQTRLLSSMIYYGYENIYSNDSPVRR